MPMRADATRNLQRLLAAAREAVAEKGAGVPLDEVAQRAGVGIATLYRRFPDRDTLLRAVVLDALTETRDAAEAAERDHPGEPFEALAAYLRTALELRVSAVMPQVLDVLDLMADDDVDRAREASAVATQRLVDAAHEGGAIAPDVTFADIGMMLVRLARPLPGPLPADQKHALARRHLELFLRGLRADARSDEPRAALVGPALSRVELSQLTGRHDHGPDRPSDGV
jgi:AcrR family transcriptional regulator